jgi:hypothetical protein
MSNVENHASFEYGFYSYPTCLEKTHDLTTLVQSLAGLTSWNRLFISVMFSEGFLLGVLV